MNYYDWSKYTWRPSSLFSVNAQLATAYTLYRREVGRGRSHVSRECQLYREDALILVVFAPMLPRTAVDTFRLHQTLDMLDGFFGMMRMENLGTIAL
jgi:hypothetical protein